MVDEAERSLHDALSVLSQTVRETRIVLGGGCAEMTMSNKVDEEARRTPGKKAIATEAFAKALRQVSADARQFCVRELVAHRRPLPCFVVAHHPCGQCRSGLFRSRCAVARRSPRGSGGSRSRYVLNYFALGSLVRSYLCLLVRLPPSLPAFCADLNEGKIASMLDLGVTESYKLKRQVVLSASEAAEMILR